jgi:hypothetical protein
MVILAITSGQSLPPCHHFPGTFIHCPLILTELWRISALLDSRGGKFKMIYPSCHWKWQTQDVHLIEEPKSFIYLLGAGNGTQSLAHDRQVLYPCAALSSSQGCILNHSCLSKKQEKDGKEHTMLSKRKVENIASCFWSSVLWHRNPGSWPGLLSCSVPHFYPWVVFMQLGFSSPGSKAPHASSLWTAVLWGISAVESMCRPNPSVTKQIFHISC